MNTLYIERLAKWASERKVIVEDGQVTLGKRMVHGLYWFMASIEYAWTILHGLVISSLLV